MVIGTSTLGGKLAEGMDRASGYVLAFAATCTATGIRFAMQQELQERNRMLLFIPAVLVSAMYGGVGPGIFALLLGAFMCAWILIPHITSINIGDRAEQVSMLLYLAVGAGLIVLVHRERVEKQHREMAQQALKEMNLSLEARVSERTRELELANRELEDFCYSVSHDLRTPSRAITGNIHILMEDYGEFLDGPIRERLTRISRAAVKLGDLVDALLAYARLAHAGQKLEVVDLGSMVAEEIRHWEDLTGTTFHVVWINELLVTGDKSQLRSAVEELVANAAVYRKKDRAVCLTLECERVGTDVVVSLRDNGIGFDTQYLHKIFQPFERLHRDGEYPGVGMGLAKVARIAERHGGSVRAESTQGEGSTFYLRLGNQPPVAAREKQLVST